MNWRLLNRANAHTGSLTVLLLNRLKCTYWQSVFLSNRLKCTYWKYVSPVEQTEMHTLAVCHSC